MSAKENPETMPDQISATMDVADFRRAVNGIAKFREPDRTIPILQCIIIKVDGMGAGEIIHAGIDTRLTRKIKADGPAGCVAIAVRAARAFCALAGKSGKMLVSKTADNALVSLSSEGRTIEALAFPHSEAPETPWPDELTPHRTAQLSEVALLPWLRLPSLFMSDDETRYYLNGVCLEFLADNKIRAVATNGHQLAAIITQVAHPLEQWTERPIIPRRVVLAVLGLLGGQDAQFDFMVLPSDPNAPNKSKAWPRAKIESASWRIDTKLINGTFPKWSRVVPLHDETTPRATLPTSALVKFRAAMRCNSARAFAAAIDTAGDGTVKLESIRVVNSRWLNEDAAIRVTVPGEISPAWKRVGFNSQYLATSAAGLQSETVTIASTGPADPAIITAPNRSTDDLIVIMPMRI